MTPSQLALAELERIVGCRRTEPGSKCACGHQFIDRHAAKPRHQVENYVLSDEPDRRARLGFCRKCGHSFVCYEPYNKVRNLTTAEAIRLRERGWSQLRGYIDPIVERMIG